MAYSTSKDIEVVTRKGIDGITDFIRQHIVMNGQDCVNGYFFGSETYYPAKDYIHVPGSSHITWKYAFERQWL